MPSEFEKETHNIDSKGRKRKRKTLRSIAEPAGAVGAGNRRVYTPSEKELILTQYNNDSNKMKAQTMGNPSHGDVARKLQLLHPSIFGLGAPGMPTPGASAVSPSVPWSTAPRRVRSPTRGGGRAPYRRRCCS